MNPVEDRSIFTYRRRLDRFLRTQLVTKSSVTSPARLLSVGHANILTHSRSRGTILQRPALNQVHDQVGDPRLDSRRVHTKHVRVIQPSDRFDLALKTRLVLRPTEGEQLDRHTPLQARVDGFVDGAHASAP